MNTTEFDHDVIIVGGGPVGLMLSIELGRRGIDVHVVERRETRLRHPRAVGIHARTMELFRQLGWAEDVRRAGDLPLEDWCTFGYMTRLKNPDIGAINLLADPKRVDQAYKESPEMIAWCAQDTLEPFLLERAKAYDSVTVTVGLRMTAVEQYEDHVVITATEDSAEADRTLTARYLVGADGVRSTVRNILGIDAPASPPMGHQLNACFQADLSPYIGDRRHILWWIINADTSGAFLTYDGHHRWVYSWAYDPTQEQISDYPPERSAEVIRSAIGDDNVDVQVDAIFPWTIDSALADRFQQGRCFLVGDAAHRFPPSGGFGMNSGIQDAQNLAWKLALVLQGQADAALLDTYSVERRYVAARNAEQTLENVMASAKVGWTMTDPEMLARIEGPDGGPIREQLADAIPLQEDQYWSYGQQFGFTYNSDAVVGDGTEPVDSAVGDYRPNAGPGAHAPHVWLSSPSGDRISTVDLLHSRFVLLTGPEGAKWVTAAGQVAERRGINVDAYTIGSGGDFVPVEIDWAKHYGITTSGAVLVRPDGHVAFRAPVQTEDPLTSLETAFAEVIPLDSIS